MTNNLKPRTLKGTLLVRSLSMKDTNGLLYNNGTVKRRKVAYRAKYPLILDGGGVGSARTTSM